MKRQSRRNVRGTHANTPKRVRLTLGALVLTGAVSVIGCQPGRGSERGREGPGSSFEMALDSVVPAALAKSVASGAVIAFVDHGRIRLTKGYGLADKESRRPMTDSTPIGVASVSKLVSSWGLLSLAAKRLLPLDRPIDGFTKTWQLPSSRFDRNGVTVRRLLSHTAGLSMLSVPCFPADSARPSLVDVLGGKAGNRGQVELTAAPASEWRYSGGGFTLLQLAAEEVTANSFANVMQQRVFEPLGMNHSYFGVARGDATTGYDDTGKPVAPFQCVGEAAAGLVSTARDMAKLLAEYPRVKQGHSPILPAGWIDTLASPIAKVALLVNGRSIDVGDAQMGLGHFLHVSHNGHRILFHSGGNPGVAAYLLIDIDDGSGLFMAVNSDSAGDVLRAILAAWGRWARTDPPTAF